MKIETVRSRLNAFVLFTIGAGLLAGCAPLLRRPGVRANTGDLSGAFDFAQ